MKGLDIDFEVRIREIEEVYDPTLEPEQVAEFLATLKAEAFIDSIKKNEIIITSDTVVIHDGEVLEKPANEKEAIQMITRLSASEHKVITGVCVWSKEKRMTFSDETIVEFEELSEKEIRYYVTNYQPYDKAGSYGVQEWIGYVGIKKLSGSYFNVMGLPLRLIYRALKEF